MKHSAFKFLGILFTSIALTSCNVTKPYLQVSELPEKITYEVGEPFSIKGLSVQAVGDDIVPITSYKTIPSNGYTFTIDDVNEHYPVQVLKDGYKSVSFDIKVVNYQEMEIKSYPNTTYKLNDIFSSNGLEVVDSKTKQALSGYTLSIKDGDVLDKLGTFFVDISLEGYRSINFAIKVAQMASLKVKSLPTKVNYKVGDAFNESGLVIVDNDNNEIEDYVLSIATGDILKYEGEIDIIVEKENYESTSFKISVEKGGTVVLEDKNLNIYYINDTHGCFQRNSDNHEAGMAYIGQYLKYKKSTENCLVLSGGDMFQGGIESNKTRGKIFVDAMNDIGFDAMVLGNHEFDWGEQTIIDRQKEMRFPLLSCNLFYAGTENRPTWLEPYTIINKGGLKVGIVGFAQQGLGSSITRSISSNFYFPNPISYVQNYAEELRFNYNCDLVIAAGHDGGFSSGYSSDAKEYEVLTTNSRKTNLPYIDGLFFAHDHVSKYGTFGYNNTPFLESGCNGGYIGYMDFELKAENNTYKVKSARSGTINAYSACTIEDKSISALVDKYRDVIGDPDEVICTLPKNYTRDEFAYLTCKAMLWYVNSNPNYFENQTVYLATHNTGGVRDDVPAGPFTYRLLFKCLPFDNPLAIQKVTKNQFSLLLDGTAKNVAYTEGTPIYSNNVTNAVSISYIVEYSDRYQQSYKEYFDHTTSVVLCEYLSSGLLY